MDIGPNSEIVNYNGSIGREMTFPHRSAYSSLSLAVDFF